MDPNLSEKDEVVWHEESPLGLLGFDLGAEQGHDRSGLKALINSALVSHRRLPMLDVVFDRTARLMSTSLRQLTNENVEVTLDNVSSTRFSDFVEATAGVIGVVRAKSLDGYILVAGDAALVHGVVDLLLGGRRASAAGLDDRALTAIELGLANRMLALLVEDFDEAFAPVAAAGFTLERIETTPRFAAIAQDASVCAVAKFKVRIDEFASKAMILVPHATIEPVRELLSRDFIGESGQADERWRRRLGSSVAVAGVEVVAALADRMMTIGEVAKLKEGDTLSFSPGADSRVELRSGGAAVVKGKIGRMGEAIAVKLDGGVNNTEAMKRLEEAA